MNDEMLKQLISDVIESAEEVRNKSPLSEFERGMLLAYRDVLKMFQIDLTTFGPENYGLDFDVDDRYMILK